jgi:hypothetical protein
MLTEIASTHSRFPRLAGSPGVHCLALISAIWNLDRALESRSLGSTSRHRSGRISLVAGARQP